MIKLTFTRPIRIIKEGDICRPSIVSIMIQPFLMEDDIVTRWKFHLYINLWILEINIQREIKRLAFPKLKV